MKARGEEGRHDDGGMLVSRPGESRRPDAVCPQLAVSTSVRSRNCLMLFVRKTAVYQPSTLPPGPELDERRSTSRGSGDLCCLSPLTL